MNHFDALQQAINAAKPVKIVALRARRELRRLMLDKRIRAEESLKQFERMYGVKNESNP
jgi:hypothetical protein